MLSRLENSPNGDLLLTTYVDQYFSICQRGGYNEASTTWINCKFKKINLRI